MGLVNWIFSRVRCGSRATRIKTIDSPRIRMSHYIFDNNSHEREFRRLQLVEAANDPTTIALLEETGIQAGWHCLELGTGAGSILR